MKKQIIGFGLLLPDEVSCFVRRKEVELAKKFKILGGLLQPPHVTIKWPFETNEIEKYEKYGKELSKQIEIFELEYDKYDSFNTDVIFLKVKDDKKLVDLHLKILKDLKQRFGIDKREFEGENQIFHTTIAMDKQNFNLVKEEVSSWPVPDKKFNFTHIALLRYTGKKWIISKSWRI